VKNLPDKKYRVVYYERVDPLECDLPEPMSLSDAQDACHISQCRDPENIYKVEEIDEMFGYSEEETEQSEYRVHVLVEIPIVVEAENENDAVNKALEESADIGGPSFLIRGLIEGDGRLHCGDVQLGTLSKLFDYYPVCTEKEYQDFMDCPHGNTPLTPRDCS